MTKIAFIAGVMFALGFAAAYLLFDYSNMNYTLTTRSDMDGKMTVPVLRPSSDNHRIALDITPRGKPDEMANHGLAWIDVCDTDLLETPKEKMRCARVAITKNDIRFGTMAFNGADTAPIRIVRNSQILAEIAGGEVPELTVGAFNSSDVLQRLEALGSA